MKKKKKIRLLGFRKWWDRRKTLWSFTAARPELELQPVSARPASQLVLCSCSLLLAVLLKLALLRSARPSALLASVRLPGQLAPASSSSARALPLLCSASPPASAAAPLLLRAVAAPFPLCLLLSLLTLLCYCCCLLLVASVRLLPLLLAAARFLLVCCCLAPRLSLLLLASFVAAARPLLCFWPASLSTPLPCCLRLVYVRSLL